MRIGVTGARGILGRLLVAEASARGWEVSAFPGDIADAEALASWIDHSRPEGLAHLAAVSSTRAVDLDPARAWRVNVVGAGNIARLAAERGCWLLHASSSHVYRPRPGHIPESSDLGSEGLYGRSKLAAEAEVAAAGGGACVARIFSFHHPDQDPSFLVPSLRRRLATEDLGRPFMLRGAANIRDFSTAESVADRLLHLIIRRPIGPVNVGSGRGQTIAEIARELADRPLEVVDPSPGPPTSLVADISRLRALLGDDGRKA